MQLKMSLSNLTRKIDKTLVLEPAGDDLKIVAVNERKSE